MTDVARFYCLASLMVFTGIPNSDQLPVRAKPVDSRLLPADEDPVTSPDVSNIPDPLENIGVELSQGFLIEGDIRVWHGSPVQENSNIRASSAVPYSAGYSLSQGINSHQTRNSVTAEETWLERVIPYEIDPIFNSTERQVILDAIYEIMAAVNNCTVFVEREKQEDFLYITGQQIGCWSDVGKVGGNQTVSISRASECVSKGIIMHELLHALGFWHEHNRPDRDQYIQILQYNIRIDHLKEFKINPNGQMLVEYDYYSIMHYKINQFSKDRLSLDTIRILKPEVDKTQVGQRSYLSEKDKERIIKLYQCRKFLRSSNSNLTQSSEHLGHQGPQYSTISSSPNYNGNERNVQETPHAVLPTEVQSENIPVTQTKTYNPTPEIASNRYFTDTAEIGRK